MQAHRTRATVSDDGSVTVGGLPFPQGEEVDVVVLPSRQPGESESVGRTSLRGSVRAYARPFEPATDADEWEST